MRPDPGSGRGRGIGSERDPRIFWVSHVHRNPSLVKERVDWLHFGAVRSGVRKCDFLPYPAKSDTTEDVRNTA